MKYFWFLVLTWTAAPAAFGTPCEESVVMDEAVLIREAGSILQKHDGHNTGNILSELLDYLKIYKVNPVNEENDLLFNAMRVVEQQFRPVFRRQLQKLGWGFSETITNGGHRFVVKREDVLKTYPILAPFLPDDTPVVFAPSFQIPYRATAFYSAHNKEIGLPLSLLFEEPDLDTIQAIVHELVHHHLEMIRRKNDTQEFSFSVIPNDAAFALLSTRINPYYASDFSSEEIFAFLVNALNAYEIECAGFPLEPKSSFRSHFLQSWPALVAYLGMVIPALQSNQSDGFFEEDETGLYYVSPEETYRVRLQTGAAAWANLPSEQIRREMNRALIRETEVLLELHEVYEKFERVTEGRVNPRRCDATEPVWDYLEKFGLPRSQFRIIRR